ncbi:MAG TPA: hypothetical protein VGV67_05385 [Solirubrobacteraceae bacterium]|nr:hypothetical protein [Solirubrobacteraceae bacterium]
MAGLMHMTTPVVTELKRLSPHATPTALTMVAVQRPPAGPADGPASRA